MSTTKAVIFDLGKVLLDFDYSRTVEKILEKSRVGPEGLQALIDQSPLLIRYEKGLLSTAEFIAAVRERAGYSGSDDEFAEAFADIFSPIQPMIDLHARLYENHVPTYIFSNTNELAIRHVKRQFPFFAEFDGYIYSYVYHSMKPETRLYEAVERAVGCGGDALLYLDDRKENVEAGLAHGWNAHLHESPEKSAEIIRAAGLVG
jgi:HAD superfamily hydrolase (TIGR01509 family)